MALHLPKTPASLAAAAGMVLYGMFTGSGTATVRAVVMFAVRMGAVAVGRTYDSLRCALSCGNSDAGGKPLVSGAERVLAFVWSSNSHFRVYPVLAGRRRNGRDAGKTGLEKLAAKGKEAAMVYLSLQLVAVIPLQAWSFL